MRTRQLSQYTNVGTSMGRSKNTYESVKKSWGEAPVRRRHNRSRSFGGRGHRVFANKAASRAACTPSTREPARMSNFVRRVSLGGHRLSASGTMARSAQHFQLDQCLSAKAMDKIIYQLSSTAETRSSKCDPSCTETTDPPRVCPLQDPARTIQSQTR